MSAMIAAGYASVAAAGEAPAPLTVCPRCGRQVRLDGHCECEALFGVSSYGSSSSRNARKSKNAADGDGGKFRQ